MPTNDEDRDSLQGDVTVLIPAAGQGLRLGGTLPKALRLLRGRTLLQHAVDRAAAAPSVSAIIVAAPPGWEEQVRQQLSWCPLVTVTTGAQNRQASVAKALALAPRADIVLVHDAARALTPPAIFEAVAAAIRSGADAAVPALAVTDTIKVVDAEGIVTATPQRENLRAIQTPQGCRADLLARAHAASFDVATDDAGLIERLGGRVKTVPGSHMAMKITHPADMEWAQHLLDTVGDANQGG
ncbi:2-C-methyl-D-erythritol 4-phosphate cytidylyltransferase [Natronoglycomyces albus]